MNTDKRQHPRLSLKGVHANITISNALSEDSIHLEGDMVDMSYSGIRIKLLSEMPQNLPASNVKIVLTLPNSDDTLDAFFSGDDIPLSFAFFSAVAYLDSVSGDGVENGFKEIVFEIDLGAINEMLFGFAQVAVFNDDIEIGGFFVGFEEQAGDFDGALMVTPGTVQVGTVQVSAPTTALFVLLSIGGMFVARRK